MYVLRKYNLYNKQKHVIAKIYFRNKAFTKSLWGKNERFGGLNAIKREKTFIYVCRFVYYKTHDESTTVVAARK